MNKAALDQMWDQFRQKYGVYLRLLETIPVVRDMMEGRGEGTHHG